LNPQGSYNQQLRWISKKFVIFYDLLDRRGWLVDGASALLHLVRASFGHDQKDVLKSLFLLTPEEIEEPIDVKSSQESAIAILTSERNKDLKLYEEADTTWEEEIIETGGNRKHTSNKKKTSFRFKDRVQEIYLHLEQIIAHQEDTEDGVGKRVKLSPLRHLEGFDFVEIASGESPVRAIMTELDVVGKGWVDLTRAIHAITLFGCGFGELIQPVTKMCDLWSQAPQGQEVLIVSTSDITKIMQKRGNSETTPWQLVDNLYWMPSDELFDRCKCNGMQNSNHSDKVQLITTDGLRRSWGVINKGRNLQGLTECGAVVFGHSHRITLPWKNRKENSAHRVPETSIDSVVIGSENDSSLLTPSATQTSSSSSLVTTGRSAVKSSRTSFSEVPSPSSSLQLIPDSKGDSETSPESQSSQSPPQMSPWITLSPVKSNKRTRFDAFLLPFTKRQKRDSDN
jgi:hypothetical protein